MILKSKTKQNNSIINNLNTNIKYVDDLPETMNQKYV